ncbi:MAG: hypothetical protein KDD40_08485 [Bdellovibrionales bacterium]|nr:hypothetical protein [Bdellovibrionales bacterium]
MFISNVILILTILLFSGTYSSYSSSSVSKWTLKNIHLSFLQITESSDDIEIRDETTDLYFFNSNLPELKLAIYFSLFYLISLLIAKRIDPFDFIRGPPCSPLT